MPVPANIRRAARHLMVAASSCLVTPFALGAEPGARDTEQLAQRCLACHRASLSLSRYGEEELSRRIVAKRDHPAHVMLLKDADEALVAALAALLAGAAE